MGEKNPEISKVVLHSWENNWVESAYDIIIIGRRKRKERISTFSLLITMEEIGEKIKKNTQMQGALLCEGGQTAVHSWCEEVICHLLWILLRSLGFTSNSHCLSFIPRGNSSYASRSVSICVLLIFQPQTHISIKVTIFYIFV